MNALAIPLYFCCNSALQDRHLHTTGGEGVYHGRGGGGRRGAIIHRCTHDCGCIQVYVDMDIDVDTDAHSYIDTDAVIDVAIDMHTCRVPRRANRHS